MRVGLSWDVDPAAAAPSAWGEILDDIHQADRLGYESVWIAESREGGASIASPAVFLTHAAQSTRNVQLRIGARRVSRLHPVRIAEEVAVLDLFSRGRAGIAFAPASRQGVAVDLVHETVELVAAAWACDELRYRGDHVRFPTHTPDAAPPGVTEPEAGREYLPQWEWGPAMPDFLAVTPKPFASRPPLHVEVEDDETLDWAARHGIAPMIGADVPTDTAVERLARYRKAADSAGRSRWESESILERRLAIDAAGDGVVMGGTLRALVSAIRDLRAATGISHFVWRRCPGGADLARFAGEVQMLLQA